MMDENMEMDNMENDDIIKKPEGETDEEEEMEADESDM